jgi:hypothetical protein
VFTATPLTVEFGIRHGITQNQLLSVRLPKIAPAFRACLS